MKQDREELLRKLDAVSPGLAIREAVEQNSCFVFRGGRVTTFNDELACSIEADLGIEGAVAASPLLELLRKMAEAEIDVTTGKGELLVKGKKRRAGITFEEQISLPVDSVELPEKWAPCSADFGDAVSVVAQCASKDANQFALTCVHLTPKYIEACDNFQLVRHPLKTGVREECLVKASSLKHVAGLGVNEISEGKSWLHFRNPAGLVVSVRREVHDYQNLAPILDVSGSPTTLPSGIDEAVEKAEIFSAQNAESNVVIIELRPNQLRLKGVGAHGWYEERKQVKWDGDSFAFTIQPNLLREITARTHDCEIAPGRLKVDNGSFTYVSCLGKVEE